MMGKPTYDELKAKYDDLIDEQVKNNFIIEELSNRINDAIHYINTNYHYSILSGMDEFFGDYDVLISILRGNK